MSGSLDRFAMPCFEGFSIHDEQSENKERKSDLEWSEDERNHIAHPQMTPLHEEAKKLGGKAYVGFLENADSVPMVEKAVATGWKEETSMGKISASNGALPHSEKHKSVGVQAQLFTWLMAFLGPPSPTPGFTETDLLSVMRRLDELEENVETLERKPSEMPYEKEELLDATLRRVDALEAELIATKKALHEALRRQELLLAYIDREEGAKFRKKKLWF